MLSLQAFMWVTYLMQYGCILLNAKCLKHLQQVAYDFTELMVCLISFRVKIKNLKVGNSKGYKRYSSSPSKKPYNWHVIGLFK